MSEVFDEELIREFVAESNEHIESVEADLLDVEQSKGTDDVDLLNRIFRGVHSIKGGAGFFGFKHVAELTHVMESMLSKARARELSLTSSHIDKLLSGIDKLKILIDDVSNSDSVDVTAEVSALDLLLTGNDNPEASVSVTQAEVNAEIAELTSQIQSKSLFNISREKLEELREKFEYFFEVRVNLKEDVLDKHKSFSEYISGVNNIGAIVDSKLNCADIQGLEDCLDKKITFDYLVASILDNALIGTGVEVPDQQIKEVFNQNSEELSEDINVSEQVAVIEEVNTPPVDSQIDTTNDQKQQRQVVKEETLRVNVGILNKLLDEVGELVLGRNQLMRFCMPLTKDVPGLDNILQYIDRVTSELQANIMNTRMQQMNLVFSLMPRMVRDLTGKLGKKISLHMEGKDVELDKSIIEGISDPLVHMMRNVCDHAIETPQERLSVGKDPEGNVYLKAYYEAGVVNVEMVDDGKGIDPDAVAQKAFSKGLISAQDMATMNNKDKIKLIFMPGFSTAQQISSVSGRGVGMDVVRSNIEKLGGAVDIESVVGKGTTVKLTLPLTLAILSGLVVTAGDQRFVIPQVNIEELVQIKESEKSSRIELVQDSEVLRLRGELLPLIRLGDVLSVENMDDYVDSNNPDREYNILIVKMGVHRFSVMVDSILESEEIVVKPLSEYVNNLYWFSGATIMGDGSVSLIIDITGLAKKARIEYIDDLTADKEAQEYRDNQNKEEIQSFLIFENGTSERYAIPLSLIKRIDEIPAEDIQKIGDNLFVEYMEQTVRLICLDDYLPVNKPGVSGDQRRTIIIPKYVNVPVAILVNSVVDSYNEAICLEQNAMKSPGVFGTAFINNEITLVVDVFHLFEMAEPDSFKSLERKNFDQDINVLLVEDTQFFRIMVAEYLRSAGYNVVTANNGKEALSKLKEGCFDIIVSDIVMPNMDGFELAKHVRLDSSTHDIPILGLIAITDEEQIHIGNLAGFDDWVIKIDKRDIVSRIDQLLSVTVSR